MDLLNTIIAPIITEKSSQQQSSGQYVFKVGRKATKPQIKKMFEVMYGTKARKVQIMLVPRKTRLVRGKKVYTKRPVYKKAIITLAKGEKAIDINKILVTKTKKK